MAKATHAEVENRIDDVLAWIVAGRTYADMVRNAAAEWGISRRQLDTYIQRARLLIKERAALAADDRIAEQIARREKLYELALKDEKYDTALRILDSEAKLLGLVVDKTETTIRDERKPPEDMTDEELDAFLAGAITADELHAKRERAEQ